VCALPDDPENIFKKIIDGKVPCYKARRTSAGPPRPPTRERVTERGTGALTHPRFPLLVFSPLGLQIFETEHALAFLDAFPMTKVRGRHRARVPSDSFMGWQLSVSSLTCLVCLSWRRQGHSLLIPKATGYADIYDMPPDVAASVLRELPRLAKAVRDATGCEGVNIVQNNGKAAGQVVFHAHFHVIPRFSGDGLVKLGSHGGGGSMIDPAVAKEVGDAIRAAL